MFNHEPEGYRCPFCELLPGGADAADRAQEIVLETDKALALMSPKWWPNNHGNVLVVPTAHHENVYDLPDDDALAIHQLVRRVAVAMRSTYGCDGVSTRQHNEPAGNQDVWHLHVHVFPRYKGDDLYGSRPYPDWISAERRRPYAEKLRGYLGGATTEATKG